MKCDNCGKELTKEEEIYYDFPPGSKKVLCLVCYDKYLQER
jgi:hypothetical protein